jgi:hypothetical protein
LTALQNEDPGELARTDFVRFRRVDLCASNVAPTAEETALHRELTNWMADKDAPAMLDVTGRLIAADRHGAACFCRAQRRPNFTVRSAFVSSAPRLGVDGVRR